MGIMHEPVEDAVGDRGPAPVLPRPPGSPLPSPILLPQSPTPASASPISATSFRCGQTRTPASSCSFSSPKLHERTRRETYSLPTLCSFMRLTLHAKSDVTRKSDYTLLAVMILLRKIAVTQIRRTMRSA
jgi:hypothetical protein